MADIRYRLDKKLIVVPALFRGKDAEYDADLILDTGASYTILDPSVITALGYTEGDRISYSTVQSPVGKERGFRLHLNGMECLGRTIENFEVACHSLGLQHIDGLLGMNFLERFDYCIFPSRGIVRM